MSLGQLQQMLESFDDPKTPNPQELMAEAMLYACADKEHLKLVMAKLEKQVMS